MDYNYNFDIIEIALKKTTAKSNPNFNYINSIITDWYTNGLKTKEEILIYDAKRRKNSSKRTAANANGSSAAPQQGNFEQRKYEDGYLDSLYENA